MIMKKLFFLCALLSCFSLGQAEDIFIQPQGEYAEINISREMEILNTLSDAMASTEKKRELAEEVYNNSGSYAPPALIHAAIFYISENKVKLNHHGKKIIIFGTDDIFVL